MKGHVRERGKSNWYAVLSMRDSQTGKRKVKFVSLPDCKGKREAQEKCSDIIRAMHPDLAWRSLRIATGRSGSVALAFG